MITRKEVEHVAKLARLGFTPEEIEKFRKELSSILGYVEKLKKVDVSQTKPTSHPFETENVMREDRQAGKIKNHKKLLDLAPETKEGYLKVKQIF